MATDLPDFCPFVPDDPMCQVVEPLPIVCPGDPMCRTDPEPEPTTSTKLTDTASSQDLMTAQFTFLISALTWAIMSSLDVFRYRSSATFYDSGTVLGTNWW